MSTPLLIFKLTRSVEVNQAAGVSGKMANNGELVSDSFL
jgi:hypothetical protein